MVDDWWTGPDEDTYKPLYATRPDTRRRESIIRLRTSNPGVKLAAAWHESLAEYSGWAPVRRSILGVGATMQPVSIVDR